MRALLDEPSSGLGWFTEQTGSIWFRGVSFPFGVNDTGLITVYSKRIAQLPAPIQRTIVVHNATPEGGPSRELLATDMEVSPTVTTVGHVQSSGVRTTI